MYGCLKPYVLVQFLPMLIIMLLLNGKVEEQYAYYWTALGCYIFAKLFEHIDHQVYQLTNKTISGHTIKHLWAAVGMWILVGRLDLHNNN